MKKEIKLLLLLCLFNGSLFAQFGQITSIQVIPTNPTDNDQIAVVVEVMLGSSPCNLDNSSFSINSNNIQLNTFYCEGMLATICSRIDTISLGTLTAGSYNLELNLATGCPAFVSVDSSLSNGFTVTVFSGISAVQQLENFSVYPNPTNNSLVNIKSGSLQTYSITCYNSLGQALFAMNNLRGNQAIHLPKENGIYFIKITDHQNQTNIVKCINASK
jgi:hypothetical protein